ncbi:redoxin domain-containing protein [Caldilinea sp.]|uniref:TlpA family protein disulfide reductase n=1 Tax=Caldilinea sp. TaxID=2293560 RepID=UPI002C87A868|nr:redoxin domain-containing protein [Anaerolineales bacterium]HQY91825.1 redoxin domain-containing protein [Caldilinea sp.]HRA65978.1 redoxin domain-containing protein [Caldilinea sp.]
MNRWGLIFLVVLVLGAGWLWWTRPGAMTSDPVADVSAQPAVGRPAPDFTLPTLDGGEFRLSDYRGKPVVLNFWATWCGPCQRELPAIERAAEHYRDVVVFAAVDQAETQQRVQEFVDEMGLTVIVPMDGEQVVGERYDVLGLPTTFFIDENGIIRSVWMGEMNSIVLAEHISGILR